MMSVLIGRSFRTATKLVFVRFIAAMKILWNCSEDIPSCSTCYERVHNFYLVQNYNVKLLSQGTHDLFSSADQI